MFKSISLDLALATSYILILDSGDLAFSNLNTQEENKLLHQNYRL